MFIPMWVIVVLLLLFTDARDIGIVIRVFFWGVCILFALVLLVSPEFRKDILDLLYGLVVNNTTKTFWKDTVELGPIYLALISFFVVPYYLGDSKARKKLVTKAKGLYTNLLKLVEQYYKA